MFIEIEPEMSAPSATTAVSGYASALFANSADNNLYWRNSGGTNVQLTAGNSLNVAGFVGGIGGDYASRPELATVAGWRELLRRKKQTGTD